MDDLKNPNSMSQTPVNIESMDSAVHSLHSQPDITQKDFSEFKRMYQLQIERAK